MKLLMIVTSGVTASSSTSSRISGNCMAEPETGNVISHEQLTESLRDKREGSVSSSFCKNTLSSMHMT